MKKRVGIFVYYEWLPVSPSLVSAVRYLSEQGYLVDVVHLYNDSFGVFKPESENVHSIAIRSGRIKLFSLLRFISAALSNVLWHKYNFLVGVDQEGIIVAGILARLKKIRSVYYSLELITREDVLRERGLRQLLLRLRYLLESYFARAAAFTIVQDRYRAEVLIEDKGINENKMLFVPNSYYFQSGYSCADSGPDSQIPPDKKIIIYTGSIIPEMAIEEIISGLPDWPQDALLLLHTPYRTPYLAKIEEELQKNNLQDKVLISISRLSFEDLSCLIKKAAIGLSFYRKVSKSFALGPAGKLSFYLSQGVPVITSKIPSAVDLIQKYGCGVCLDFPEESGGAIKTILDNYSEFVKNTRVCYENELEFSRYFKKALEKIESAK